MKFKAILFDLGGTLWDFKDENARNEMQGELGRKFIEAMARYGIEVKWDPMFIGSAVGGALWAAELKRYYTTGIPPNYPEVVESAARYWIPQTDSKLIDWNEVFELTYVPESQFKRPFDETIDVLESLRSMGLKMVIVSNRIRGGRRFAEEWHEKVEFSKFFDGYVLSCDIGFMKPRREIFERALQLTGTGPNETMMVGDLLRADVLGANRMGITSVWVNRSKIQRTYESIVPDFEIASLTELIDIVK